MEWLLLVGTIIVGALAFWGLLGIWAESLSATPAREMPVAQPREAAREVPAHALPATVLRSEAGTRIQCELLPNEQTTSDLAVLLREEENLATEARERGLDRAAHLHEAIAQGLRDHLGVAARAIGQEHD